MERQLRARLGAARMVLDEKSEEERRVISSSQVAALKALVAREPGLPGVSPDSHLGPPIPAEVYPRALPRASSGRWPW